MRFLPLVGVLLLVLAAGCGGGVCATTTATASPTTFSRGATVTITVTYPRGAFASVPTTAGFVGDLVAPDGVVIGSLASGVSGAVTGFSVTNATTMILTLNVPASSPAGTYAMSFGYGGRSCPDSTASIFGFTVN